MRIALKFTEAVEDRIFFSIYILQNVEILTFFWGERIKEVKASKLQNTFGEKYNAIKNERNIIKIFKLLKSD